MKKILLCLLLILSMFNVVACGSGEDNTEDTRPTFTVGMECAYAPFNWTEYEKTDTNYPIEDTKLFAEGYDVQISKMMVYNPEGKKYSVNYKFVIEENGTFKMVNFSVYEAWLVENKDYVDYFLSLIK